MTDYAANLTPDDERPGGTGRRVVARNVAWNWAGTFVTILAGFVVSAVLVHRLGEAGYGLWIVIASLTGYFGLLDLGIRGSVSRYIAYHYARGDSARVNAVLNTALAILVGGAVLILAATFTVLAGLLKPFEIPPEHVHAAHIALVIVGINLAVSLPLTVFDSTLWAFQRFDVLNAIDIPSVLLRTVLSIWLVTPENGLVALALLTLFTATIPSLMKIVQTFRINPQVRVGLRYIDGEALRSLFGYGVWHFLLSVSRQLNAQLAPVLIGAAMGVRLVTPFSIASRLVGYAGTFMIAASGVLTPVTTALHAREEHDAQRQLFLSGGKYCLAIALFFLGAFLFLGEPFIRLWMGAGLAVDSARVLVILILGEVLPLSQLMTLSMIQGMGRNRPAAIASLVEGVTGVGLALVLSKAFGLMGVCAGFAVAAALCRGAFLLAYGCQVAEVQVRRYLAVAVVPPVAAACIPALVLALLVHWTASIHWWQLIALGVVYSVLYVASFGAIVEVPEPVRKRLRAMLPAPRVTADAEC